eukprot:PhF_6_TR39875/c0_g1_i1/m.59286
MSVPKIVFSDVDGTCVHYIPQLEKQKYIVVSQTESTITLQYTPTGQIVECIPVPSATQSGGLISIRTLHLVSELRHRCHIQYVLLTGARSSTYLTRRKVGALPEPDYDVFENGGRIMKDGVDDMVWYDRALEVTGPLCQDDDAQRRSGLLWDAYRDLRKRYPEWLLDAKDFSTAFMVDVRKVPGGEEKLREWAQSAGTSFRVNVVVNLGKGHVIPFGTDKADAAGYILKQYGYTASDAVAMFDDDNDLQLAALCSGGGYVIGVAHDNVKKEIERRQREGVEPQWVQVPLPGPLGTEYALEHIMKRS